MATNTPNYNFDLREGSDIFNPLSSNANWESLDTLLKTIQETGGITTYTTTASADLLKLSGTPKVNDTVFKFVAAGNANTWTAATGGVVNKIVGLDGVQMTIKSGNMYVAWINSANSMVCVVWPEVVNAQTFDGKGPSEWATKVQLDAVNQTAANATQTAQAAATVANNALEKAEAAGMALEEIGSFDEDPSGTRYTYTVNLNKNANNYKAIIIVYSEITSTGDTSFYHYTMVLPMLGTRYFTMTCPNSNKNEIFIRGFNIENDGLSIKANACTAIGGTGVPDAQRLIIRKVYGIK